MKAHFGAARSAVSFASCDVLLVQALPGRGADPIVSEVGGKGSVPSVCGRFVVPGTTGELLNVCGASGLLDGSQHESAGFLGAFGFEPLPQSGAFRCRIQLLKLYLSSIFDN